MGIFTKDKAAGCLKTYTLGTALYAHLTRGIWPDKPSFVPSFGPAKLLRIKIDRLWQRIVFKDETEALCLLQGPQYDLVRANQSMCEAGLKTVGVAWENLDLGEVRASGYSESHSCDVCFISKAYPCLRHESSTQCKSCFQKGLPCSWTPELRLRNTESRSPELKNFTALLDRQPIDKYETTARQLPDPGFSKVELLLC